MLTREKLKSKFEYNPKTGLFTLLSSNNRSDLIGKTSGWTDPDTGYVLIHTNCKKYRAHRLAFLYMTGNWPDDLVDHINGIRDDNRWENLRQADKRLNSLNRKASTKSTTGVCGLTKRGNKYLVRHAGKHIATFNDKNLAAELAEFIKEVAIGKTKR